jgi:hypothetical protein
MNLACSSSGANDWGKLALFPGRSFNILPLAGILFNGAICAFVGGGGMIAVASRCLRAFQSNGLENVPPGNVMGFLFGLVMACVGAYTLCAPYRLTIKNACALEFKRALGTLTLMPQDIQSITTACRLIWWEGGDARIIHITHGRGRLSVSNFDGAELLFTQLISTYPHIRTGSLDFTPDIKD